MKKLLIVIFLLTALAVNAQDTLKIFYKVVDYGKQTRIDYKCFVIKSGSIIDTVCIEKGKGSSQGTGDSLRVKEYEALYQKTLEQINKLSVELEKQKADNPKIKMLESEIIKLQGYLETLIYLREQELKRE